MHDEMVSEGALRSETIGAFSVSASGTFNVRFSKRNMPQGPGGDEQM